MKISSFLRPLKDGKSRIWFDYYVNGKRHRQKTDLVLFDNPKNQQEREYNKEIKKLENVVKYELNLQIQNNKFGIKKPKHKIDDFIDYFEFLTKKRESSGENYSTWKSALKHLNEFAPNGIKFIDLDEDWLNDFKCFLIDIQQLKTSSSANYFNVVLHGVHKAFKDRMIDVDYADDVKAPKVKHAIREYLTEEEITKLENTECKNPLLKKAFLFSCKTGMAYADVKNLKWKNIKKDLEGNYTIPFHRQKTDELQYLPIVKDAIKFLRETENPDEEIFKDLNYNSWMNTILREWVFMADIKKAITFHCARHSFATIMLHKGVSIVHLSKLLNHKDIKTTMIYAKVINIDLRNAVNLLKSDND
ncbi:MAG: site-specific integrase [Flavobacteriaceae bacterium]|nr:site-specific integrase [Flavobacteriaceae bacterium]